ncbi:hydantoinase/oxoprolinase N-terminal domain-containing protein [Actinomadura kijaniata]|uniref:hydantoinase/oxoprolinase N-terminal domain-containing protein n=1 Tax=Actinomadura kijaniata TaxID=46161 RepID=UPI003F1AD04A
MRIGIDVGGTNTDAVLLDGDTVLASVKSPTTPEVTGGVTAAIRAVLDGSGIAPAAVTAVMIGTTHFVNALVEADRLAPTAAVRLGLPAGAALPPMVDWPARLRAAVSPDSSGPAVYLCHGGHEYDGSALSPLDEGELRRAAADIAARGVRSVAVSAVFSPVSADAELRAAEILAAELGPEVHLSLSHEIGRVGLLPRENATVVNAALRELAVDIVTAFTGALAGAGVTAPLFLSQNDGTLMDVGHARTHPVATFASGPTNSMRGAAYLSGLADCAVVDVGGTTADVGVLTGGFPREASGEAELAGVRTNFRIPDVLSLGIGGGSLVDLDAPSVGPRSVGYRLTERALVFGGDTLTATDLAVAAGHAEIGDPARVARLDRAAVAAVLDHIAARLAETVDRMRTSADPIPVVAVGGGSVLITGLPGFADVRRPAHHAVANAIGAAIAQVGGEVDRVFQVPEGRRAAVLEEARAEAVAAAERAGARPGTVAVVDVEEVPLAYLPGGATRVRVKAVGDLDLTRLPALEDARA